MIELNNTKLFIKPHYKQSKLFHIRGTLRLKTYGYV